MARWKNVARKSTSQYSKDIQQLLEAKRKDPEKKEIDKIGVKKKKKRIRRGTVALREIQHYQKTVENCIPALRFQRCLTSIVQNLGVDFKFQGAAMSALQIATEAYLLNLFENATLLTTHARRVTLFPKDLILALRINRNI